MAAKDKLRVGVVGAGFAGRSHMEGYKKVENADLIAVCDVSKERAQEASEKYGIPKVFTDLDKMLELDELDAISVCLPNVMHRPATVAGLEAGKHVLCEKPLATNAEEAAMMVEAAEKSGKTLAMALNFRYMGTSLTAKKMIEAGERLEALCCIQQIVIFSAAPGEKNAESIKIVRADDLTGLIHQFARR